MGKNLIVCIVIGVVMALFGITWFDKDGFNIFGASINIILVTISSVLAARGYYDNSFKKLRDFFKVSSMVLLLCFFVGCAKSPADIKHDQEIEALNNEIVTCVIKRVEEDSKGRARRTYYIDIQEGVIYCNYGYLGNAGDTIKVKRGRMQNRQ